MSFPKFVIQWLAVLTVTVAVFACAGSKPKAARPSGAPDPNSLIQLMEKDLNIARRNQVHVLSPILYAKAEGALNTARQLMAENKKTAEVIDHIKRSQVYLLNARDKSQVARAVLSEVIKNRSSARSAGAVKLGKDYTRVEEQFSQLARAIENNNVRFARNNGKAVSESFRVLEIRAIKVQAIGEVRKLLQQARDQRTNKIAPRSYDRARSKLQQADQFISANPYKKAEIQKLANAALFEARRHLEIGRFSRKLEPMQPEPVALLLEEILIKISEGLSAPDMRDHTFETQVDNILGTIAAQKQDRIFTGTREKELQNQIERLTQRLAELEDQKNGKQVSAANREKFNQQAKQVGDILDPREADVYVDDLRLLIRLKSIRFPVGKSVIQPENYELLGKVQRVIRMFGSVDIIIQGHTDSTGSEKINEQISEQRADAVRHFLVADDTLSYDRIIAVGYGSMRPIAPNTSKKGRAMNRRIDLMISPHF